jgi:DNA-binding CsgD family transcriptional regulator
MLIGRQVESAALAAALASAREGSGSALVLVGEPGIGKTTLLRGLVDQAGEMTVLETAGVESEADLPYAALIDVLKPVLHRLDALPEAQAVALSSALALGPPGVVDRFAVGVATLGLLAAAVEAGPALIVVDDLQWVDSASRDALSFAARRLTGIPAVFVAAQRAGAPPVAGLQVVPVGPLDREDATRVLAENEGRIAPEVLTRILDAAHGNPLALVELPHLLTPGQLAGTEVLANPIPTANGLERAFAARLAPLSSGGRLATLVAAADSSGTAGVVLGAFVPLGIGERDLDEVESLGLLHIEANRLEFRHPLVRSAAYHGADAAGRRLVHAALAEADSDPDRRAWHRAAATLGLDDSIADELDRAGARALARGAFGAGAAALERAASLTEARAARGARLLRAANAMDAAGNLVRSEVLAHEAAPLIDDPRLHAELVILLGRLRMAGGEVESGHSMLLEEAEQVAELDPELAAALLSFAANLPVFRLEGAAAVELTERAWKLGDPTRPRMPAERNAYALAKTMAGDVTGPALLLELAHEAGKDVHTGHQMGAAVGWPLVWVEEYTVARTLLTWAVGVQRSGGSLRHLPQSLIELAELDFRVGRWVPALAGAYEAIGLFEETAQRTELGFAQATIARMEAALGRDEECRRRAQAGFAADAASGLLLASVLAGAALGLLELGRGDPEAAIVALEPVERIVREGRLGEPWLIQWAPDLIEACSRVGRNERATEVLGTFERQAQATGRVSAQAAAARCRGLLAPDDAFEGPFDAALALHALMPTPFERGRTELAYGERLRRTQKRSKARERLQAALQIFEGLGAEPWAERARTELRASGQSVRTPEQQVEDALTPQELQVAALVAGGATNREAAAALFLSVKTIEFHLGHVYRKLGIRSRTELARVVGSTV